MFRSSRCVERLLRKRISQFSHSTARSPLGHLKLCHLILAETISKGDIVIDATCGNGHDTLFLAQCALDINSGFLYGFDIQVNIFWSVTSNVNI